jgi:hypothetical protein
LYYCKKQSKKSTAVNRARAATITTVKAKGTSEGLRPEGAPSDTRAERPGRIKKPNKKWKAILKNENLFSSLLLSKYQKWNVNVGFTIFG